MIQGLLPATGRVAQRLLSAPMSLRRLTIEWLIFFSMTTVAIYFLPSGVLNWGLFGVLAGIFVVEAVVMGYKAWLRWRRTGLFDPEVGVLIGVRFVLGAYFVWSAARAVLDPGGDGTPESLKYGVRAFVIAWGILELRIIPYRDNRRFSVVSLIGTRYAPPVDEDPGRSPVGEGSR